MENSLKLTAKDITLVGLMVAIIEVCKVLMKDLPNIELTTFWIIMFTLYFGKSRSCPNVAVANKLGQKLYCTAPYQAKDSGAYISPE